MPIPTVPAQKPLPEPDTEGPALPSSRPRHYVQIARPDHWFKNVLVLPGTFVAALLRDASFAHYAADLLLGLASVCLVASANYVLNEWLDAEFDRFHPIKRQRPSVAVRLDARLVWAEYVALSAVGLALAGWASPAVAAMSALLWLQGIVYNVPPLRTKDRVFLDVLSESVNNAIRLALGWYIVVPSPVPPVSLVLGYWMLGAFLMAMKRFAEMRFIGSPEVAGLYRRSFRSYTEERLMISAMLYAFASALFLAVFMLKYRVELLLTVPFLAVAFAWYLHIGMKPASAAQTPERLYRERGFVAYLGFLSLVLLLAFSVDVPALAVLLEPVAAAP